MKDQEISELKKKYNPQFKKLILLILEPIQNDFGEDRFPGYNEYVFLHYYFNEIHEESNRIIVKPHPRQDREKLETYYSKHFCNNGTDCRFVENEKIENLIVISNHIYGMTSVSLIIAIQARKRVTSLQINRNGYGKTLSNLYLEKCLDIGR